MDRFLKIIPLIVIFIFYNYNKSYGVIQEPVGSIISIKDFTEKVKHYVESVNDTSKITIPETIEIVRITIH